MQAPTAAKRSKKRIVPSRYMQHSSRPSDDKENISHSTSQPTATKATASTNSTSAPSPTLPPPASPAVAPAAKPSVVRSSRTALSTLPVVNNRMRLPSTSPFTSASATPSHPTASATDKPTLQPSNIRRRTHDIADHLPVSVTSHRSSLALNAAQPVSITLPVVVRPQLSDLTLHCHQAALLQSLYWHAAVERAHNERREAAEKQLGVVAAVVRSRLSEERQCQQRIARIRQSEADHYSLAAQHAAIIPLLPVIQQAASAHNELSHVADTLKAQLRLEGVAVEMNELTAEVVQARTVLDEIVQLLHDERGGPSLASSLSALSPSLSTLLALLAECAPVLGGTSDDLERLQDRVERESSVAFAQLASSSEGERERQRQEAGGRWQW